MAGTLHRPTSCVLSKGSAEVSPNDTNRVERRHYRGKATGSSSQGLRFSKKELPDTLNLVLTNMSYKIEHIMQEYRRHGTQDRCLRHHWAVRILGKYKLFPIGGMRPLCSILPVNNYSLVICHSVCVAIMPVTYRQKASPKDIGKWKTPHW